jgi:hypothetical protein
MHTHHKNELFPEIDPPEYLFPHILSRITLLKQRAARIRFILFSGTTLMSFLTMIAALRYAWGSFAESSFSAYASLLSSDGSAVLLYWKEFAFSLIESVPLMGITVLLSAIFTLLLSLKLTLRYLGGVYGKPQFTQFA